MKTVNLETARKLKEAGYPQESYFYYGYNPIDANKDMVLLPMLGIKPNALEWYAAPTADEILDVLPDCLIDKQADKFVILYSHKVMDRNTYSGDTLAEASAICWLYLKSENLLKQ